MTIGGDYFSADEVDARIDELESDMSDLLEAFDELGDEATDAVKLAMLKLSDSDEADYEELQKLKDFKDEVGEWANAPNFIADSQFADHAEELARETTSIDLSSWPMSCIDWAQAASELQQDYSSVDFDSTTYWYR
jgi:hypothetical protein